MYTCLLRATFANQAPIIFGNFESIGRDIDDIYLVIVGGLLPVILSDF
jgi:hypothetical protein